MGRYHVGAFTTINKNFDSRKESNLPTSCAVPGSLAWTLKLQQVPGDRPLDWTGVKLKKEAGLQPRDRLPWGVHSWPRTSCRRVRRAGWRHLSRTTHCALAREGQGRDGRRQHPPLGLRPAFPVWGLLTAGGALAKQVSGRQRACGKQGPGRASGAVTGIF